MEWPTGGESQVDENITDALLLANNPSANNIFQTQRDMVCYLIAGFKDCSVSLPTNTATRQYFLVTVAGNGAVVGDLLYDKGTSSGTNSIIPAKVGANIVCALTQEPYIKDVKYTWSGTEWVKNQESVIYLNGQLSLTSLESAKYVVAHEQDTVIDISENLTSPTFDGLNKVTIRGDTRSIVGKPFVDYPGVTNISSSGKVVNIANQTLISNGLVSGDNVLINGTLYEVDEVLTETSFSVVSIPDLPDLSVTGSTVVFLPSIEISGNITFNKEQILTITGFRFTGNIQSNYTKRVSFSNCCFEQLSCEKSKMSIVNCSMRKLTLTDTMADLQEVGVLDNNEDGISNDFCTVFDNSIVKAEGFKISNTNSVSGLNVKNGAGVFAVAYNSMLILNTNRALSVTNNSTVFVPVTEEVNTIIDEIDESSHVRGRNQLYIGDKPRLTNYILSNTLKVPIYTPQIAFLITNTSNPNFGKVTLYGEEAEDDIIPLGFILQALDATTCQVMVEGVLNTAVEVDQMSDNRALGKLLFAKSAIELTMVMDSEGILAKYPVAEALRGTSYDDYDVRLCSFAEKLQYALTFVPEYETGQSFTVKEVDTDSPLLRIDANGLYYGSETNSVKEDGIQIDTAGNLTIVGDGTVLGLTQQDADDMMNAKTLLKEPCGVVNADEITLTKTADGVDITSTSNKIKAFYQGAYLEVATPASVNPTKTAGTSYVVYINSAGELAYIDRTAIPTWDWPFITPLIAILYYNGIEFFVYDELHDAIQDSRTHALLHDILGTRIKPDGGFSGSFADAGSTITGGTFYDEGRRREIATNAPPNGKMAILYRDAGVWKKVSPANTDNLAYWLSSGQLQYDNAGTHQDAASNAYVANWVFLTNDVDNPYYLVIGQRTDTTIANSRANSTPESLVLTGLPVPEMKLLYRVICRNAASIVIESLDYRTSSITGSNVATVWSHQVLSDRENVLAHPQYLLTSLYPFTQNGTTEETTQNIKVGDANDSITITKNGLTIVRSTDKWVRVFLKWRPLTTGWVNKDPTNTVYYYGNNVNSALTATNCSNEMMLPNDFKENSEIKIYVLWAAANSAVPGGLNTKFRAATAVLRAATAVPSMTLANEVQVDSPHDANKTIETLVQTVTHNPARAGDLLQIGMVLTFSDSSFYRTLHGVIVEYKSTKL